MYSRITRSRYDCWNRKVLSRRRNVAIIRQSIGSATSKLGMALSLKRERAGVAWGASRERLPNRTATLTLLPTLTLTLIWWRSDTAVLPPQVIAMHSQLLRFLVTNVWLARQDPQSKLNLATRPNFSVMQTSLLLNIYFSLHCSYS